MNKLLQTIIKKLIINLISGHRMITSQPNSVKVEKGRKVHQTKRVQKVREIKTLHSIGEINKELLLQQIDYKIHYQTGAQ